MLTGQILLQLISILLIVQLLGFICTRIGQQWVIGEILAGLVLGPSVLGLFLPNVKSMLFPISTLPTLQTLGDIGLMLYMFSLGTHLEINLMKKQGRNAIIISLSGIIIPFLLGGALGFHLYSSFASPKSNTLAMALFVGTAMSITAFPVLARLLTEKKLLGTRVGLLALTCASIDDIIAWCLLSLVIAISHSASLNGVLLTIGLAILFIVLALLVVRPLLAYSMRFLHSQKSQIVLGLLVFLLFAYTTNAIGIHPVFGAFIAGIILPRHRDLQFQVQNLDVVNNHLFLPLFFVFSGLQTQIGLLQSPSSWLICLLIIAIACLENSRVAASLHGLLENPGTMHLVLEC